MKNYKGKHLAFFVKDFLKEKQHCMDMWYIRTYTCTHVYMRLCICIPTNRGRVSSSSDIDLTMETTVKQVVRICFHYWFLVGLSTFTLVPSFSFYPSFAPTTRQIGFSSPCSQLLPLSVLTSPAPVARSCNWSAYLPKSLILDTVGPDPECIFGFSVVYAGKPWVIYKCLLNWIKFYLPIWWGVLT